MVSLPPLQPVVPKVIQPLVLEYGSEVSLFSSHTRLRLTAMIFQHDVEQLNNHVIQLIQDPRINFVWPYRLVHFQPHEAVLKSLCCCTGMNFTLPTPSQKFRHMSGMGKISV